MVANPISIWMKAYYVLIVIVAMLPPESRSQEVILLRSAKTLAQDEILTWESFYFAPLIAKYDFTKEKFVGLDGDNYKFTSYTMLGYGITNRVELLVQLPVYGNIATQEGKTSRSAGVGDISLQTRFMLNDGKEKCPAINVGIMARFPTGNILDKTSFGKGTIGLGISTIITKKIDFFIGHLKLGYIFNGTNSERINQGDKLLYMVKGDFIVLSGDYPMMKELALMIGLSGSWAFEDINSADERLGNTRQYRPLNIVPMIRWTPMVGLFIRPKVIIPIKPLAQGGKYCAAQYVLDVKYSF